MIEVQIRRPCREPEPIETWTGAFRCPDCKAYTGGLSVVMNHRLVVEWIPLEQAIQLAHTEETQRIGERP